MPIITDIRFYGHRIFNEQTIYLSPPEDADYISNFITLIIGQNGSGKSELLKEITKSVVHNTIEEYNLPFQNYINSYTPRYYAHSTTIGNPKKIIALAHNLTDKFPITINNSKNYKYLGIKSTSNAAFIGKYKKLFLNSLLIIMNDRNKFETLKEILYMLNLPTRFVFSIKENKKTRKLIELSHINIHSYETNEFLLKLKTERDISSLEMTEILSHLNNKQHPLYERLTIDFEYHEKNEYFLQKVKAIDSLLKYSLAEISQFSFDVSDGFDIPFSMSSSGENLLLSSIFQLVAEVDNHSLILIDEPEASLHPNWQIEYVNIMNTILRNFIGCHTIICTHSHFIVSNTPNENSLILHAKRNENEYSFTPLDIEVYGNSPDNILYTVFGIASTRNHYFTYDLKLILQFISEGKETSEVKEAIQRITALNISYADPLSRVINKAQKMIG